MLAEDRINVGMHRVRETVSEQGEHSDSPRGRQLVEAMLRSKPYDFVVVQPGNPRSCLNERVLRLEHNGRREVRGDLGFEGRANRGRGAGFEAQGTTNVGKEGATGRGGGINYGGEVGLFGE